MVVEQSSRGFGDTIAKITNFFGIQPCGGCEQRRDVLNQWLPYQKNNLGNANVAVSENSDVESAKISSTPTRVRSRNAHSDARVRPEHSSLRNTASNLIIPTSSLFGHDDVPAALRRDIHDGRLQAELMEIFAAKGWRAPDRQRGPLDLEGDRRNRRTERRDERDESRTGRRRSTSATSPILGTTQSTYACGVDVTQNVKDAVQSAKNSFASWSNDNKHKACQSLHSFSTGAYAWDILELHSQVTSDTINNGFRPTCATSGATPACGSSVTVDNSCHFAGSANYVIFGVMCKLCSGYYNQMLNDASWYELIDKDSYRRGIIHFSRNGMLSLIDLYKKYIPLLRMDTPAGNIDAAKRWSIAGYLGWPSGASTPIPDRGNCTLTCPSVTSIPNFRVSWYPHLNPYSR